MTLPSDFGHARGLSQEWSVHCLDLKAKCMILPFVLGYAKELVPAVECILLGPNSQVYNILRYVESLVLC